MAKSFDRGDTIRCAATFVASVFPYNFFDPPSVFFLIQNPLGSTATYGYGGGSVIRVATGAYYTDVIPSCVVGGKWPYRFDSTSGAAGEGAFNIRITSFL